MNLKKLWCVLELSIVLLAGSLSGQARAGIVPGDFDNDCDVDAADFQHFRTCALGAAVAQSNPACVDARLDADADVDMDDFGIFQRCYSGEGVPANPNCNHTCVGPDCNCVCGQTSCNGTCRNTRSDNANCGVCGNACAAGFPCQNGTCWSSACPPGSDFNNDGLNCGSCGHQCAGTEVCSAGECWGVCIGCE
jgi:hypothetical protein